MIVNSSHALRLSVCRRRYGPPSPPPLLQAPSTVPAPPPHRLRGTRRAFRFPNRSQPSPPAGPTRHQKPSLALCLSRLAACTCELRPISTVPQPQGSTTYRFSRRRQRGSLFPRFFFCFDAHGCRCPAGCLLRPSGTRLFAHHLLILRAMAQRPTSVEAARWWIALSHRPWLRRVPVARQAFVRYGYLVYETTLTGECACMSSKRRQY